MLAAVDSVLRSEGACGVERGRVPWSLTARVVLLSSALFGAAMGSFGAKLDGALYSAIKVPLLVLGSAAVGLPFLFALNSTLGLRRDAPAVVRAILASQATLAVCLAGLAPLVLFLYASRVEYPTALLASLGAFGLASIAGQVTLARHYRPLIERDRRHRVGLSCWLVLYVFVAIQLGWILRPLVGDPRLPTRFLREEALDENPYLLIAATVLGFVLHAVRAVLD